jgi:hypothetical protein
MGYVEIRRDCPTCHSDAVELSSFQGDWSLSCDSCGHTEARLAGGRIKVMAASLAARMVGNTMLAGVAA